MEQEVLSVKMYEETKKGYSVFSGDPVTIIGEQVARLEDGREIEQYLYHIDTYTAKNGKPFVALKANISVN